MNPVQTIIPLTFVGSLPWWYYDVRIGWLGMIFIDRISMRWLDLVVLGVLVASGILFYRQARVAGELLAVQLFRVAMLLSLSVTACLAFAVILTFALVPYVPASFPPATPGTWISMALTNAAPVTAVVAGASVVVSLFYLWPTRNSDA